MWIVVENVENYDIMGENHDFHGKKSSEIFFKIISSKKYSTVFNDFLFPVKQRSSVLTSAWNQLVLTGFQGASRLTVMSD